jgi:hypothetical protein
MEQMEEHLHCRCTVDALFGTVDSGGTGNEEGKEHFAPPDTPAVVDGLTNCIISKSIVGLGIILGKYACKIHKVS